jgi:four helix bundle protein
MQNFRNLAVWRLAHGVTLRVYTATAAFPTEERYGLAPQIRRSAVSVPSNIAEACGRESQKDARRVLNLAFASACELEYQLFLAYDLVILPRSIYEQISADVIQCKRMLAALTAKIAMDSLAAQRKNRVRAHGNG